MASQAARLFVGVRFLGRRRRLVPKPERTWRLHLAALGLLQRRRVAPWEVQIFLGYTVNHFQLMRPGMAVLSALYAFAGEDPQLWLPLPGAARRELLRVSRLCFLAGVDLAAPFCREVFCSGASLQGYALHVARTNYDEMRPLVAARER